MKHNASPAAHFTLVSKSRISQRAAQERVTGRGFSGKKSSIFCSLNLIQNNFTPNSFHFCHYRESMGDGGGLGGGGAKVEIASKNSNISKICRYKE